MRCGKRWKSTCISCETERRISSTLHTKIWQVAQNSSTKAEKMENDFREIAAKIQELDW